MLPSAAQYHFLWEIGSGKVPIGATVRTFGRLSAYDLARSEATITAQHACVQHQLQVRTSFVEPFSAQLGSYYLVLGELEGDSAPVLCPRLMICVEGADLSLLQQAVEEQRRYIQGRESAADIGL
ncbi:CST complex subunit TEN1 [Spea bombifrons]|uniref:CST complex subunit TEN1 n=1 Tax=Spea bombifrons TaxID=233779 RepID=UPI00234AB4F8|nr:CST complex subunit TEN1 [Spea bombifrons]